MKNLLIALNAKYIHTCLAVYSLKAYAAAARPELMDSVRIDVAEYTINDRYQDVLAGIMGYHADILGFSTYIWNVDRVHRLIRDIRRIRGDEVRIWAGGPEAIWYPETFLRDDGADLCMLGEGEVVFAELVNWAWRKFKAAPDNTDFPTDLPGLAGAGAASRLQRHCFRTHFLSLRRSRNITGSRDVR